MMFMLRVFHFVFVFFPNNSEEHLYWIEGVIYEEGRIRGFEVKQASLEHSQSLSMRTGKPAEPLFISLGAFSRSRIAKTDFKKFPAIYSKWEPTF